MKLSIQTDKITSLAFCLLMAYAATMLPSEALAATGWDTGNPIGDTLCTVVSWFTGPIGQGVATLAIIVIGVGALMGKVSWGMAIIVGIGVAVIFGAPAIVDMLSGHVGGCNSADVA